MQTRIRIWSFSSSIMNLTDSHDRNTQQKSNFVQNVPDMPCSYRTMMGRSCLTPSVHKFACTAVKTIATVRITDLENRTFHRFTFGNKEEYAVSAFTHRQKSNIPMFHAHLYRQSFTRFAMKQRQRNKFHPSLGYSEMRWSVMTQHHDVIVEIHRIEFRE